jgi:ActR/RegA family two-component response regulator
VTSTALPGLGELALRLPLTPAQSRAVRLWDEDVAAVTATRETTRLRELRIDLDRRLAVLERQAEVVRATAEAGAPPVAVLVVHRDPRAGARLAEAVSRSALADGEVVVTDSGADAVGRALLGQPAFVVVDTPVLMMTPLDVVADLHRLVPDARVVACAEGPGEASRLQAAGAAAVYRRGAGPDDVAALLAAAPEGADVPGQGRSPRR